MGLKPYLTAARIAEAEFVERKSRFVGQIAPVATEDEAKEFIELVALEHPDASHGAWCYIFNDRGVCRASDAGEPSGTAGRPIAEVLQREGLTGVACVVTRYFGGILLGAGGLIRAYATGAKIALDAAGIAEMRPCAVTEARIPFHFYGKVKAWLPKTSAVVTGTDFGEDVVVKAYMPVEDADAYESAVVELTNGKASVARTGELYMAVPYERKRED